MTPLQIGKNYIFVEQIENIITPATRGNMKDAAVVYFVSGRVETYQGEEAEAIRAWLSKQLETVPPTGPVVQTKAPTPKR